jgi:predicted dehydrogenase
VSYGVGVVGCGRAALDLHLPALRRVEGAHVAALADADPVQLENARRSTGIERCHGDYRALIEDDEVSIVLVAVPPGVHGEVVRACLSRGKHVLVEKPLASSPRESLELVELARSADVAAAVGHNLRCHRLLQQARDLLRDGVIGEVEAARSVWSSDMALRSELPEWRTRRRTQGGVIHEMGVHHFDLWRFLLGREFLDIAGLSRPGERDDDSTAIACRLEGGVPLTMLLSQQSTVRFEIEVLGAAGRLSVDCLRFDGLEVHDSARPTGSLSGRLRALSKSLVQLPTGLRVARLGGDLVNSYRLEWEQMVAALSGPAEVACSFADGYQAALAADAAAQSVATGKVVSLKKTIEAGP